VQIDQAGRKKGERPYTWLRHVFADQFVEQGVPLGCVQTVPDYQSLRKVKTRTHVARIEPPAKPAAPMRNTRHPVGRFVRSLGLMTQNLHAFT